MSTDWTRLRAAFAAVIGIVVTPFDNSDQLDEAAFSRLVQRIAAAGVGALTPNGNTSEFYSLSREERHRAVALTLDAAPGALVVPGVGGDVHTAAEDAHHYAELGAHAVMVHEPAHPFWSADGWLEYHQRISEMGPDLGVAPYLRSPRVTPSTVRELVSRCPNVIAIKYAIPDPVAFATMVQDVGSQQVAWVCGLAEAWAPYFALAGAVGFTSGLVSVDPDRSLRMFSQLQRGDYAAAMAEWCQIREFEAIRARDSSEMNVTVVKEALAHTGHCDRTVRPPLSPLIESDRERVAHIVSAWA